MITPLSILIFLIFMAGAFWLDTRRTRAKKRGSKYPSADVHKLDECDEKISE